MPFHNKIAPHRERMRHWKLDSTSFLNELKCDTISQEYKNENKQKRFYNQLKIKRKGWLTILKSNPITSTGRKVVLGKIVILTLIPVILLFGVNVKILITTVDAYMSSRNIQRFITFSIETGNLIHYVQKERGAAVLTINFKTEKSKELLRVQFLNTDNAISMMSNWPDKIQKEIKNFHFHDKKMLKAYLHESREKLYNSSNTSDILFYDKIIASFMDWLSVSIIHSKDENLWPYLVAYHLLVTSKEETGIEQKMGTAIVGSTNHDSYNIFKYVHFGNHTLELARKFAPHFIIDEHHFQSFIGLNFSEDSYTIRNGDIPSEPIYETADDWFANMTTVLNTLYKIQRDLANEILNLLTSRLNGNIQTFYLNTALCLFITIICPLVIKFVITLTTEIQSYAATLTAQTKALNLEKKRTDSLLYQMLPASVAEKLKRGQVLEAELHKYATVYFSDIVGFTSIAAKCTPMQVINILNHVYITFDSRIQHYKVYKVETIGDTYMVVSGVLEKHDMHAQEIASMALDLLQRVQELEIPYLNGQRINIRSGINTGPVVAGIVGYKMPRYCLFGDTVNTASRMESTSLPNYIQLTQSTYNEIATSEIFKIVPRGEIQVKGKGNMFTYWLFGDIPNNIPVDSIERQFDSKANSFSEHFCTNDPDPCLSMSILQMQEYL